MCHVWTYPADPEQRGLGRLRRAHCLREEEQMLGKSAGEVDEDRWGNNAVFVTLQISPYSACFQLTLTAFMCVLWVFF